MMPEGRLVALECIDESVLEALTQRLYRWLGERGIAVEHTAEPTAGPVGAQIMLYRQGRLCIDPLSLALYDVADRMDHLSRPDGMLSWLSQGRTVLCARYLAYAYACHLDHADLEWLRQINARCRVPDLTLFVEVEPDKAEADLARRYQAAVNVLQNDGQNVVLVDGQVGLDQLLEIVCLHVAALHGEED